VPGSQLTGWQWQSGSAPGLAAADDNNVLRVTSRHHVGVAPAASAAARNTQSQATTGEVPVSMKTSLLRRGAGTVGKRPPVQLLSESMGTGGTAEIMKSRTLGSSTYVEILFPTWFATCASECQKLGCRLDLQTKHFLLAPLAALFCTSHAQNGGAARFSFMCVKIVDSIYCYKTLIFVTNIETLQNL